MSLTKLIEAVEAGVISTDLIMDALEEPADQVTCLAAFDGYLDAAKRLHDALLPGWGWEAGENATFVSIAQVWRSGRDKAYVATSDNPARAWLLAILRALEQEGR